MTDKIVTVFGGSGFIGRNVVRELARAGYRIRVAVRKPNEAMFLQPMGTPGQIGLFQVNIRDEESVARVLRNTHAVVNLVGILHQTGGQKFKSVQAEGAERVARLAKKAGAEKFVQISAIGANPKSGSGYAKSKGQAEVNVRQHFPEATILRPSIVFGPEDQFFNRFAAMASSLPFLPVIGGGKTKFQPVHVDDVADAVIASLHSPIAPGRVFELGGPRVMSFKECMKLMMSIIHQSKPLIPFPYLFAYILGFFAQLWPFHAPVLTVGQVSMLKKDNVVGMTREQGVGTLADLGITPTAPEAVIPSYLMQYRPRGQYDSGY